MAISKTTLNIRFGYGIRVGGANMASISDALRGVTAADPLDRRFSRPSIVDRIDLHEEMQAARRDERNKVSGADARFKTARNKMRRWAIEDAQAYFSRAALSEHGFKERMVAFWSDHFTVSGKNQRVTLALGAYTDEAIRVNVVGSFADILKAVVTHPGMLLYLDQVTSFGPNSVIGKRQSRGLNENLAREVLELHTMGVDGSYTQDDVRQFAELLTGLRLNDGGFYYDKRAAEPGAEQILGKSYGARGGLQDVLAFLDDLAVHPDTAAHISRKLAVHFISENPPEDLVAALTKTYRETGGELTAVYKTLLEHPASAARLGAKVKWPTEFVISTLRALDLAEVFAELSPREVSKALQNPLQAMGMDIFRPAGPDGWSEAAADWITPPTLAARIEWAVEVAKTYGQTIDPRELVIEVLGEGASNELQVAVAGAESKWEGVALLLVSPEFNRR
ncbi:MAG: hypothetical protein COA53_09395 [Rhodobacteraceae bacterium]|nr:MAG: hypothetical protein COA53_09395 [Paracoccaceae bacterium]